MNRGDRIGKDKDKSCKPNQAPAGPQLTHYQRRVIVGGAPKGHTEKAETAMEARPAHMRMSPGSGRRNSATGGSTPNPSSSDRGFQIQEPAHWSSSGLPAVKSSLGRSPKVRKNFPV